MQLELYERPALLFGSVFAVFLALSSVVAIGPALDAQSKYAPLPASKPLSRAAERGLAVYIAEGCPVCHTQQVRSLAMDSPWGRPTVAADYARLESLNWWQATPGVLGSERVGPDLSNIGKRQPSDVWQLIHLFNPRAVSPWSVMPRFQELFTVDSAPPASAVVVPVPQPFAPPAGKVVATERALDLVAYLSSLRQAPLEGPAPSGPAPSIGTGNGAALYAANCAACHQASGEGVAATFPPLKGDPLVTASDATAHIATVLHGAEGRVIGGVKYPVTMPPFADQLSDDQIAAIVNHERTSWGNQVATVTAADVARVRKQGATP
jgi:cytochrome c oxidase cbb3-type subunit 2